MESITLKYLQAQKASKSYVGHVTAKINEIADALWQDRLAQIIIISIFFANMAFVGAHCVVQIAIHLDSNVGIYYMNRFHHFRIDRDGTLAEWFNYLQTALCVAFLLGILRRTRQPLYGAWALIFLFAVADDSLEIHERAGAYLASHPGVPPLPGLSPQASGELLVWVAAGSVLLSVLCWSFLRSRPGAWAAGGVLGVAFAALVFFAVGVDMIHTRVSEPGAVLHDVLGIIEDGGEMLSIALACGLALLLYRHPATAG